MSGGVSIGSAGSHRDQRLSAFTSINGSFQRGSHGETHIMGDTITVQTNMQSAYEHGRGSSRPTPPPSRQENSYAEYRDNASDQQQQLPSPTETSVNSMKRKRSMSEDDRQTPSPSQVHRPATAEGRQEQYGRQEYVQQPVHATQVPPPDDLRETNLDDMKQQSARTSQASPTLGQREPFDQNGRAYTEPGSAESERSNNAFALNGGNPWPRPTSYPTMYRPESQHASENPSHDAGQRDDNCQDQNQGNWNFSAPSEGGDENEGSYADSIHAQLGPKRKRNFSNRTKTGCMTCRRRKKKCDEAHPFCQNCSRGGFKCEGYSSRTPWSKPNQPKVPIPLQSKDGYSEPHQDSTYPPEPQSAHPSQPPISSLVHGNQVPRPLVQESHEPLRAGYMPSPASANSTTQPTYTWPSNAHPTFHSDRPTKPEFRDLPPLHNPTRTEGPRDYGNVPPISEMSRGPHSASHTASSMQWTNPSPSDARTPYSAGPSATSTAPPPIDTRITAPRPPISHETPHAPQLPMTLGEESEKDKMVRGRLFRFMDALLQEERAKCREALWRLNNAGNPQFGISEREKIRLLKQVLCIQPRDHAGGAHVPSPSSRLQISGSVGPNAHVELPFKCHYGYNITIGEDAYIGENCFILDACAVTIGAKTWIGSNVTILTAMAHTDLQHRQGANSSWQGKGVIIEEDVYIGAGSTIYPGVRLQRGAFVEPGSIVKTDQSQYGYLGYKPVYLSQGVPP
ncbi:putative c6 zinc finger domain protein [Phaeomoniella chlamydospora]|uniref:Putative c6 zinc finger domain protein n=1 Tax=Phaeomoniella chlamydospora TaxID=158046 RepID=A0A0G2EP42_PHACM|nr:putative c6 zinc finger domain protein [Phaeomoniella chlamydospora]